MGRKNSSTVWKVLTVLLLLALVGGGMWFSVGGESKSNVDTGVATPGTTSLAGSTACPDDGASTVNVKFFDNWAGTTTQIGSANLYAKKILPDGSGVIVANTTSATSGWSTLTVDCGEKYIVYATSVVDASGSAQSAEFTASKNNEYVSLYSNKISKMQIRFKDVDNDDWEVLSPDADAASDGDSTSYTDLNTTYVYDDTSNGTVAVGQDGTFNFEIQLKSATSKQSGNDKGYYTSLDGKKGQRMPLMSVVCVETGSDDEWDVDTLTMSLGGVVLDDVKSDLEDNENSLMKNAEACFQFTSDIDTANLGFTGSITTKSGQNPDTSNDDLEFTFFSEGTYLSNEDSNAVNAGFFDDSTSATPVTYSAEVPRLIVQIS